MCYAEGMPLIERHSGGKEIFNWRSKIKTHHEKQASSSVGRMIQKFCPGVPKTGIFYRGLWWIFFSSHTSAGTSAQETPPSPSTTPICCHVPKCQKYFQVCKRCQMSKKPNNWNKEGVQNNAMRFTHINRFC